MPMVGGKKFPYTKTGKAAAKKAEKGLYANINAKKKRIAAGLARRCASLAPRAHLLLKTLRIQPRQQRVVRGSNGNIYVRSRY